jgi:hypothetical protein
MIKFGKILKESTKLTLEQFLERMRPLFAKAAQEVYDSWDQDDDFRNGGGICHEIEEAMSSVFYEKSPNDNWNTFQFRDDSACHNYMVAYDTETKEMYEVDIPYYHYEKGGGYNWEKIPDVKITPNHITIQQFGGDYDEWIDDEGNQIEF